VHFDSKTNNPEAFSLNAPKSLGAQERRLPRPKDLLNRVRPPPDSRALIDAKVVRDSGPGIDPAHFERVFDAFYTTKPEGLGMGLSICRSIINAHGGRLWAEANEPRGTVFQFTLPLKTIQESPVL